jgi:hypothetical protein
MLSEEAQWWKGTVLTVLLGELHHELGELKFAPAR